MSVEANRPHRSRPCSHIAVGLLSLAVSLFPCVAGAQRSASVQIFAMVVARVNTSAIRNGASSLRPIAGGVVVTQQMALESNVDSQTLEADLAPSAERGEGDTRIAVSVRCGGHAGRCRLSGGTTPRIAIEVEVLGLTQKEVALAMAAPEDFAARVSYRLVRGEGA